MSWIDHELNALEAAGLLRDPRTVSSPAGPEVVVEGKRVVLLCSNDYLGLAGDARVSAAAAAAAKRWGAGSGASRLVSGTLDIHRDLEHALAAREGAEDVVLFSSGYLANLGVLAALTGPDDVVFSDELNHASIVDGCRLSKARVVVYPHRDVDRLRRLMREHPGRRHFIVTDTVFSMDGDVAPVDELATLDATLILDDAHATGVLEGVRSAPVVVGTLSKALGSSGGYVATTNACATLLRNRARTHVFDTAPVPASIGAAAMALEIAEREVWRGERVRELARRLAGEFGRLGYEAREPSAAIVPVIVGDAHEAVALSERLLERGVLCPAIRPPSVPEGTSRLRVTVMATHTDDHIDAALDAFASRPRRASKPRGIEAVFVTGTDTGVGKTVVTAAIAKSFTEAGKRVAIFKPLQTGHGDDAGWAAALAGCHGETGVLLDEPLAPSVAARRADVKIDLQRLVDRYRELRAAYDVVVVEGAGGLLVGIDDDTDMADLAAMFRLPIVVVARPALGTLNHTALTVDAARARGLDVLGVVISDYPDEPDIAERTNPAEIAKIASVVGVIPHVDALDVEDGIRPDAFDVTRYLEPPLRG